MDFVEQNLLNGHLCIQVQNMFVSTVRTPWSNAGQEVVR
jgi:hypothetical protein